MDLTVAECKKLSDRRIPQEITNIKNSLQKIETDARSVVSTLKPPSFESFKKKFLNKSYWYGDVRNSSVCT